VDGAVAAVLPLLLPAALMGITTSLVFGPSAWGELLHAFFTRGHIYDYLVEASYMALLGPPLIAFPAGALLRRKTGLWVGISLGLLGSCWLSFLTLLMTIG
jgi:hypothetical protein